MNFRIELEINFKQIPINMMDTVNINHTRVVGICSTLSMIRIAYHQVQHISAIDGHHRKVIKCETKLMKRKCCLVGVKTLVRETHFVKSNTILIDKVHHWPKHVMSPFHC
jgi:hypothetical protein